jgi:DNA polymerase (family X)
VAISIGADAHNVAGLGYAEYGINMARKGWLAAGDILNARPVEEFVSYARRRR